MFSDIKETCRGYFTLNFLAQSARMKTRKRSSYRYDNKKQQQKSQ